MSNSATAIPSYLSEEGDDRLFLEYKLFEKERMLAGAWAEEAKAQISLLSVAATDSSQKARAERSLNSCKCLAMLAASRGDWAMLEAVTFVANELQELVVALGERA